MNNKIKLFILLVGAFVFRIFLFPFWTHSSDMSLWVYWSHDIEKIGFDGFFDQVSWTDYLPFYFYILFLLAKLQLVFPQVPTDILYKLPSTIADLITAFYIYKILKNKGEKVGIWGAALYAFNPAVFFNSSLWGQVDGIGGLLLTALLYYFSERKFIVAGVFLAIALTFKPVFIVVLPVLGMLMIFDKEKVKSILRFCISTLFTIWIINFPFVLTRTISLNIISPFELLVSRYQASLNQYPYTSVNAFNFWSIGERWWQPDQNLFLGLALQTWGHLLVILFLVCTTLYTLKFWLKSNTRDGSTKYLSIAFFVIFLSLYTFATRAHERHMFTIFPFLAILAADSIPYLIIYALLSASYFANLYFALFWLYKNGEYPFGWSAINAFSLINTFIPLVFLSQIITSLFAKTDHLSEFFKTRPYKLLYSHFEEEREDKKGKNYLKSKWILGIFLVLAFFRVWRFDLPNTYYFDEVYHAFTAQEIVQGNPAAWEFLATPPKGFAYEWTHPPVSKLIMAGGMLTVGSTDPWAWRITGILFGFGCMALIYLLTLEIFKRQLIAIWATILFSLDGMSIVMSRIGMNDIYFLFFALSAILLFIKNRYFLSALCVGLALSSKWTTFYLFPVIFIAWILYKREFTWRYLYFLILPPLVYLASYSVFFMTGHTFHDWWETQQQMWWYHTNLKATHPYSSPWWSWPIMAKPVWLYVSQEGKSVIDLYIAGNPVIFFGSIAAILFAGISQFKKLNRGVIFMIICYLAFFLPWAISPRIMFIYHYFPSVPFMIIILAWFLHRLWEGGNKVIVIGYWALVLVGFALYYPLWTGLPTPEWYPGLLL
jgi:dolichyl-phosphate-mannose-protein mannosyltransferase